MSKEGTRINDQSMSFWLQLLHGAWIQKQLACSTKMEWHNVATTSATRSATNIFDVASLQL
jgi:hypothetical protein